MTSTTLRPCFKEVLSRHGQEHDMSARWIRRFLREINMTYRVASAAKQGDHLAEEVLDAQENLRYKLWWTVNKHGVSDKRIVNLDQTSIRVMPLRSRGWATSGGDRVKFLQDAKRQVTLCVACPMLAGQIIGQIVFTGKTKKAIPAVDMPANITCTASESHWSNTETMMEMFQAIAASVDSGPDAPIVVVLDCSHLQECEGNSQNPSCVQELPLHLLLEKRQHVHLSYKKLVSAWSEEREQREKEREREHFRFRGSGELIKLPFRSGPAGN